jgi:hypothetical protein
MREASRRVLDGVPELQWGKSGDCTFAGALEAATAATDFPCDYTAVMGATGLAFRTRWFSGPSKVRWCPSSPVGEGPAEIGAARRATGWALRFEPISEPTDRLTSEIVRSIDAGLPVLAYDATLNVAVICGYKDGGRTALMRAYGQGADLVSMPTAGLQLQAIFLDARIVPLPPVEAARQGIQLALASAKRGHDATAEDRGYWLGPAALAHWRDDIAAADSYTDDERRVLFFVSWWNFQALVDARRRAVAYLHAVAALFPDSAAEALLDAAEIYRMEHCNLDAAFTAGDAFQGPWLGAQGGDAALWTPQARDRERELLSTAAALEKQALATLGKADV